MTLVITVNGVDITAKVPLKTVKVVSKAGGVATAEFTAEEKSPFALAIAEEHITTIDFAGVRCFGGYIRRLSKEDFEVQDIRKYVVSCQDFNSDLGDDVVDLGNRAVTETDQARIIWLISTFSTRGLTAVATPTGFVQQVYGGTLAPFDYTGMNLYEAYLEIAKITGAFLYVDGLQKVHYAASEATLAPFDIDLQNPS